MTKEKIMIEFSREKIQEIMNHLNLIISEENKCGDKEIKTLKELLVLFQDSLWNKEIRKLGKGKTKIIAAL